MKSACRGKSLLSTAGLIAAGLIHALCFAAGPLPAWSLAAVQTLMLAVLAHQTLNASSVRRALLQGWLFGFVTYALGVYWIFISLHTYGLMAAPLAAGGVLALAAYLGLYTALACGLARYLLPDRLYDRRHDRLHDPKRAHRHAAMSQTPETVEVREAIVAPPKSRLAPQTQVLLAAITWAGTWATFEWWRGFVLTGFPWLNIGYAHIDSPLAGWAPVLGVYGMALAAAFVSAALAMLPRCRGGTRLNRYAATTLFAAVALALCGWGLQQIDWSHANGKPLSVRLVQGNVEQSEKFDPTLVEHGLMQHMNLVTLPPAAGQPAPTLTLMPETVLPVFQDQADPKVWQIWLRIAAERNTTIVMGVPLHRHDAGAETYTNSAIGFDAQTPLAQLLDGDTAMRYDKRHLVPFGEYVPTGFRWFVDAMKIPLGDFDRGPTRQTPFPIADQHLALNICYEDLFGEDLLPALQPGENGDPGATILANISNLGWFGDSWALEQHLNIARVRTLEAARPMLIATNTGITGSIDSKGHVLARLPTHRADILAVTVQGMAGFTPFARYGDKPVLALLALILIFAFGRRFSGRRKGE
jgi:apolipoprotein N-acyltransferase